MFFEKNLIKNFAGSKNFRIFAPVKIAPIAQLVRAHDC